MGAQTSSVAVLKTSPQTVLDDYARLLELSLVKQCLDPNISTILKLNLSWTKYFPSCSSQPWQLDGVVGALLAAGYSAEKLIPLENKTVVTDPWQGAELNNWLPVLKKYGLQYRALP